MNRQEEIKALQEALRLSNLIADLKEDLELLQDDDFEEDEPVKPTKITYTPNYPQITPTVKFLDVSLLPALVFWPWIFIYYFKIYKERQKEEIEKIRSSEEYKKQCADVDNEVRIKQAEADQQYETDLQHYNNVLLPNYQKRLREWEQSQDKEEVLLKSKIQQAEKELSDLYSNTKILPSQYRDTEAIRYICDMVSTSDYSVKESIELFEKERMRKIQEEYLYEQQKANDIAERQADTYYEEPQYNSESGGGFLSSMVKQGMEKSNIKHNRGKVGKRDLIGQAGCAKNNGGNCGNCKLRFSCSRYFM